MNGQFRGKTVLVTGCGRGVGRTIARLFAARGAHVIVNYFHSTDAAMATVAEIAAAGGSAEAVRASVAKPEQVRRLFAEVAERHGGLDVLVNNAARGVFTTLDEAADEDWARVLDTNLHGARWCGTAALPLLRGRADSIDRQCVLGLRRSGTRPLRGDRRQ
ncbi:SDR family NAD(P)-dependent oxidoreductase [Saccharomonospora sp. NPDC046836]|uniref:SDR family NAD(P)-dependent oxidoreductase n=1 Tax=Saccharomonospora sp. NPDC046836 TaxID=3156921 RepID=UPI0033DE42AF